MSHIIEDVQSEATARNPEPLNGLEARAYILNELRKWLEGQHHLFSIGKAYAQGACGFSITIALEGEQPSTAEFGLEFDDAETVRASLAGVKLQKAAVNGVPDSEFEAKGTAPVRIERGYEGSKVKSSPVKDLGNADEGPMAKSDTPGGKGRKV